MIESSGTDPASLTQAGLATARGLVASSDSDVDNLYVTLSARAARPDMLIVARAANEDAAEKLRLAGADRVVQPYATAGLEMAKLVAKPQVAAFLDIVTSAGGPDLSIEEIEVTSGSGQAGKSIRDLRVRHETGALVIAVQKPDGRFDATPSPDTALEVGDVVIAVGTVAELQQLEELFAERDSSGADDHAPALPLRDLRARLCLDRRRLRVLGDPRRHARLNAIYRSTVTISLTGLDIRPDTAGGQVVTILLIFAGMAIYAYVAGALVEIVARGVLTGAWSERRRLNVIDKLDDHYIICGYGRVGQAVAHEFRDGGRAVRRARLPSGRPHRRA